MSVTYVGQSPFAIPDEAVAVAVDEETTVSSGGALDWHGRASIVRRSDGVLVLFYRRGSAHSVNDGGLYIRFSDDDGATWTTENETLDAVAVDGFPMNPSTLAANQDAGEPWAIIAPSGDILLFMWRVDYGTDVDGTWMSRSTDGGESWSSSTGPIQFAGLTSEQNDRTFMTDDGFVLDGTIYAGARVYSNAAGDASAVTLMTSDDDGAFWTRLSTLVSAAGPTPPDGTEEVGLTYIGNDTIYAVLRDEPVRTHGYEMVSTNLGTSWGAITDITADVGVISRPRIYSRAWLRGQANWWKDPVLLMVGFTFQSPGDSHPRRPAVWVSRNFGADWDGPFYIDTETEDSGYGDIFYDSGNDQYVVVTYHGSLTAAILNQYRLTIDGI